MRHVGAVFLLLAMLWPAGPAAAGEADGKHTLAFLGEGSSAPADIAALLKELRSLGYDERSFIVESRFANGRVERLDDLAAELLKGNAEIIVAHGLSAAEAAKRQGRAIPIVVATRTDSVKPAGNLTGATNLSTDLTEARLKLLKEIAPRIARVALLWHDFSPVGAVYLKKVRRAADTLGLELELHKIRWARFDVEFEAIGARPGAGVVVEPQRIFEHRWAEIAGFCARFRTPAISGVAEFPEAGGLVSYGLSPAEMWRHTAFLIDKILTRPKPKPGKPAEMPAAQPTKYTIAVNLKTAAQIGITVPAAVLNRADKIIR